jgi:hypothetical protein
MQNIFRGDAVPVAQVVRVTPANVELGDEFVLTINGKDIYYTAAAATVADVVNGLVTAWNGSTIPEFAEVEASAGETAGTITHVVLTARTPGVPFVVAATTQNSAGGNLTIVETTPGVAPVNEVQQVELVGTYTGGTFTLAVDLGAGTETTGNIAYNAPAATVKTALEGLASVVPGDVLVTGGPGPHTPWFVTWQGQYAETEVAELTVDGTNLVGNASVQITTVQDGASSADEVQMVKIGGISLSDLFALTIFGQTTSSLGFSATAAEVQAALEALPAIGAGNVTVFGRGRITPTNVAPYSHVYFVRFQGAFAGTNVPALSVSQPTSEVTTLQQGGLSAANEIQYIDLGTSINGGTFSLTWDGVTTPTRDAATALNTVQSDLEALNGDPAGTILVRGLKGTFALVFQGPYADTDVSQVTLHSGGLTGSGFAAATIVPGGGSIDEIQAVRVYATGGTFTLTFDGQTTGNIAWNASAATVATALEGLSNVNDVDVTGAGTPADPWRVTFVDPGNQNLPQMTADPANLTGGGGQATEVVAHVVGINEVQTVTIGDAVTGGTFTLAFQGATTSPLAYNAAAATVTTALAGLVTIGAGNVIVTGSDGGPFTVTFENALGDQNVPLLVADSGGLLGGSGTETLVIVEATRSRGPNHFDDPDNWTLGHVPETADDLIVERGSMDLLYGLRQLVTVSADAGTDTLTMTGLAEFVADQKVRITNVGGSLPGGLAAATDYYVKHLDRDAGTLQLATTPGGSPVDITSAGTGTHWLGPRVNRMRWNSRYTGNVGNRQDHEAGYAEYRPLYLTIGLLATGDQTILIGHGQGSGSNRMRLDLGPDEFLCDVLQTGGSAEPSVPALLLKGTNSASDLQVLDGDVGFACLEGESGAFHRLTQRGGAVQLGAVTLAELDKTGGTLLADEATLNGVLNLRG